MAKAPADFPDRLAAAGLRVHVFDDWYGLGGDADHRAVVLHHTASSARAAPADDAAYCHHGSGDSPLYNVLVDRTGECWILAGDKSNSSGQISSVALDEVHAGRAGSVSAADRGLRDDTSSNASLFAISAQNDGTTEPWSAALIDAMALCSAVTLEVLGLERAQFVTLHRVLTGRKVDPSGPGCPYDWQPVITAARGGGMEVPDMWTIERQVDAGTGERPGDLIIGLPALRKSARVTLFVNGEGDGASLWASQSGTGPIGLWDGGNQWELWLPNNYPVDSEVSPDATQIRVQNRGTAGPVSVTVYGE